ncbi:MAG: phosphoribosylformylglycinamidine synthase subunit PurS [Rhodospirillales bacterium]|nr:phosphoribosylformylglycinamidine synthase subunit PurS [Alphaproteobacteria bacterium]MCB9987024.1 phosphoribosylformylglycinamidine synthase subunit PurS [Rhodospirillales bacterium]USO08206.1 MAG: phosphoribosylformylglycinamidine synthase subunit PurS [Rhodospirillales bacterium]
MKAVIHVSLKKAILDPQGKAIAHALKSMGFDEVEEARQGKVIELQLSGKGDEARLKDMCDRLLANPVIEDYKIEVVA